IVPKLAPCGNRPRAAPEEQAERTYGALGAVAPGAGILHPELPPADQRLSHNGQRVRGASAADSRRDKQWSIGKNRSEIRRNHRRDFAQDRIAGAGKGRVAELTDDSRAEDERLHFIARKHQRGKVIARTQPIADTRFAVDQSTGDIEIADVAID